MTGQIQNWSKVFWRIFMKKDLASTRATTNKISQKPKTGQKMYDLTISISTNIVSIENIKNLSAAKRALIKSFAN